jgi:hypothetical protein
VDDIDLLIRLRSVWHVLSHIERSMAADRIELLNAQVADFCMDYRMRCDKETKKLHEDLASLRAVAHAVVKARYYHGDDGWDRLKNAIGELEDHMENTE